MTLAQWCDAAHVSPETAPTGLGPVSLAATMANPMFSVLFNLEDFRVAGREGETVVMVPTKAGW